MLSRGSRAHSPLKKRENTSSWSAAFLLSRQSPVILPDEILGLREKKKKKIVSDV